MPFRRLISILCIFLASVIFAEGDYYTISDAVHRVMQTTHARNAELLQNIAGFDRALSERIYDPERKVSFTYLSDQHARANEFSPTIEALAATATIEKTTKTGSKLTGFVEASNVAQNFVSFTDLAYHESKIGLGFEQQLWQNAFGYQDQLTLDNADYAKQMAVLSALEALEESIYQAGNGFWNLLYMKELVETTKLSMDNAKSLYDLNKKKEKSGLSEPRIVLAFQADWLQKQQRYREANYLYESAIALFKAALELDELPEVSEDIQLLLLFAETKDFSYDWDSQKQQLRRLKMTDLKLKSQQNNVAIAEDNLKPKLAFITQASYNGIDADFGESASNMVGVTDLNLQTGLTLSLPWRKSARRQLERDSLRERYYANEKVLLERELQYTLETASLLVKRLADDLKTSQAIASALSTKYQEDNKQFAAGRINADELIRSSDQFIQAKLTALKVKYDYLQAIGYYTRVNNSMLNDITILKEIDKSMKQELEV